MDRSVVEATGAAVAAATHLTPMDVGSVEALMVLAGRIDRGVAPSDTTTIPTYLRYSAALGLTPAGRKQLDERKGPEGGKLAQLRSVNDRKQPKRAGRAG